MDAEPGRRTPVPTVPEGPVERACFLLCGAALFALIGIVVLEVVTRNAFGFSFQVSDELGGYLLVLIAFLSLCVGLVNRSFHSVEFVQARLGIRARTLSRIVFDIICLAFCLVMLWQMARLDLNSWRSGDVAPTELMTPLWLPQAVMPLGLAALAISVLRTAIRDIRSLR